MTRLPFGEGGFFLFETQGYTDPMPPSPPTETILKIEGLSKSFAAPVLQDLNLELRRGESLALVGANGAGKSTLIKMILGLVRPSQGRIELYGRDPSDPQSRTAVGYLPEMPGYWAELTARELLTYMGKLRQLPAPTVVSRMGSLLGALGLKIRGARAMGGYSKGMLQRTGVAQALLHDPDFIILDEPMSGLDPRAQEKLRQILLQLRARGKTLLVSSHSLEDIRSLCTRVVVLEKSKVVLDGPTEEALAELLRRYRSSEPWDEDPLGELPEDWA
jgi:ABC-2 type transport system ATP-binding protein